MISNRNNLLTAYFPPTIPSDLVQHQRSAIRRSQVLTIKSSNLEFHESSTNNIPQQKIKRDLDRQSPIIIRRLRPTIENFSSHQQPADIHDVYGNQLQLARPPQSACRNKSPRILSLQSKSLHYSKTIHENTIKHISKFSHSLQTPIWSPILTEKEIVHSRPLRSKSLSVRHTNTHHYHQFQSEKKSSIPDLFISARLINNDGEIFKKTNVKDLVDEWEDPKSNVAVSSDEDDSIVTHCNNSILTFNSQNNIEKFDQFASPTFIPNQHPLSMNNHSQRRPFNFCLPPVVEDINDEI